MRIFVAEYVCGGGWPRDEIAGSLAVEGRAMLGAIVEDLSRVPGVHVVTTWDSRLGPHPFCNVEVICVDKPEMVPSIPEGRRFRSLRREYVQFFERLSLRCDATLLIAPEFDDILFDLCRRVETIRGKLLGPGCGAVQLCADKLMLAALLKEAGVHTIPTRLLSWDEASPLDASRHVLHFPVVIKPRDGAGSQDNHLIRSWDEFERLRFFLGTRVRRQAFVWQLYIAGRPVSVAVLISESDGEAHALPVAEQFLSDDGRFFYRGGRIPTRDVDQASVQAAALAACRCVPGLRGYVGVDLIVPKEDAPPIVVEINPRLTTSYLGYRALAKENLAERMLPGQTNRPIEWRSGEVEFDAARIIAKSP